MSHVSECRRTCPSCCQEKAHLSITSHTAASSSVSSIEADSQNSACLWHIPHGCFSPGDVIVIRPLHGVSKGEVTLPAIRCGLSIPLPATPSAHLGSPMKAPATIASVRRALCESPKASTGALPLQPAAHDSVPLVPMTFRSPDSPVAPIFSLLHDCSVSRRAPLQGCAMNGGEDLVMVDGTLRDS